MKSTKLLLQSSLCLRAKMASMFKIVMNENARALKDALQNLNTRKSKKDQFTGILSENYEVSQSVRSKRFSLSMGRVLNSINKSKTHDRERNLSPML